MAAFPRGANAPSFLATSAKRSQSGHIDLIKFLRQLGQVSAFPAEWSDYRHGPFCSRIELRIPEGNAPHADGCSEDANLAQSF